MGSIPTMGANLFSVLSVFQALKVLLNKDLKIPTTTVQKGVFIYFFHVWQAYNGTAPCNDVQKTRACNEHCCREVLSISDVGGSCGGSDESYNHTEISTNGSTCCCGSGCCWDYCTYYNPSLVLSKNGGPSCLKRLS